MWTGHVHVCHLFFQVASVLFILTPSATHALLTHRTPATGIHLPLYKRKLNLRRRAGDAEIGLGDYLDDGYNVLVNIGGTDLPVVLDTGSSDLWVISDACKDCSGGEQLYQQASFQSVGLSAILKYGDSSTSTHAYGLIGEDTVNLAGLPLQHQFFAAINDTNTSVQDTGAAGIFGLGFPVNSIIWSDLFVQERNTGIQYEKRELVDGDHRGHSFPDLSKLDNAATSYLRRTRFPNIADLYQNSGSQSTSTHTHSVRQTTTNAEFSREIAASYLTIAPLVPRLVSTKGLSLPQFTITLQRDAVDVGGNNGMLSIGALPAGVQNDSLTWTPLRTYSSTTEGGLPAPPDSPNEEYPVAWETFVDDVYLDGVKLSQSTLTPSISVSALLDTGNSLIRGPSDVVEAITNTLGSTFPCDEPHTLAFQIGGQMFPVDPRDFIAQTFRDSVASCSAKLVATDSPKVGGFLYSWSLGDPFLKGVVATYHYGNLTYPSVDSPKIGLLSTVPSDAGDLLKAAVTTAQKNGGNFPAGSESAPSGVRTSTPSATSILQGNSASRGDFAPWGLLAVSLLAVLRGVLPL